MPSSNPSTPSSAAALALLAAPDPVPALQALLSQEPESLAMVLHALAAELKVSSLPRAISYAPLDLSYGDRTIHLDLLLLPSIFAPEAWGFTFLEGLLRKPLRDYAGKRLVELGTGSGWISFALLGFTDLDRVLGVDLNPQAVLVSRLNAVLNSFDAEGNARPERFHERFTAAESDLLAAPREQAFAPDLVIGCIPQVLAEAADLGSAQGLYDLSNYATAQGLVEDQFGLGLNARALREALHILQPGGSVILNLAGRPGPGVVARMFQRRGFEPEVLWRSRVQQASDTDISPLVGLEARTGSPFAFFLNRDSAQSVSARLADAALKGGRSIHHELQVVEGKPISEALFGLAKALESLRLEDLWEKVDLHQANDEQLRFVTRLAESLAKDPRAPYAHEAGDAGFRTRVTDFLRKFHGLDYRTADAFVAPDPPQLLRALLLALVDPGLPVVFSASLRDMAGSVLEEHGADAIWVHGDGREIAELLPLLKPALVWLDATAPLRAQPEALAALLRACEALNILLVLDDTRHFAISSKGQEDPLLAFHAAHMDSPHLALAFGLVHSQAFPDVALALFFTRHPHLHAGLEGAAELSYSRISIFHQAYYESLFDELLSFRVNSAQAAPPRKIAHDGPALRAAMEALLRTPPFARPAPAADVIRLDYGENEDPMPPALISGLLQGFLAPPCADAELHPAALRAAGDYLRATRLPSIQDSEILLGDGVLPLLSDALRALSRMLNRPPKVLLPRGSYGMFPALLQAAGCEVFLMETESPDFLLAAESLDREDFDALLLTHPANPSGASYAPEALRAIIHAASAKGAKVILDEVFGLLGNLDGPMPLGQDRFDGLDAAERNSVFLLAGLSKEFAGGGLRAGFAAITDRTWREAMDRLRSTMPPRSTLVALRAALPRLDEIETMRKGLRHRRDKLAVGLRELGFGVESEGRGGLFLFADASRLSKDPEVLALDLESKAKVRLNAPSWSGTASHLRACFSIPEARLDEALARLRSYFKK